MGTDDSFPPARGDSNWSADRQAAYGQLLRSLERMRSIDDRAAYDALCALVDALVTDGLSPEGTVIAVKDAITQSECLSRFDPQMRERARTALVASCIDRYYETREARGLTGGSKPLRLWRAPRDGEAGTSV